MATGGQAGTSAKIENYLGFPSGISGAELAERATIQARKFGARVIVAAKATSLQREDHHYLVGIEDGRTIAVRTVVVATGVHYRRLDVPGLDAHEGTSVFYAATLMEAHVCRNDPIAVIGGGNSAGQAAVFLARYAAQVRVIVREPDLATNMSRYLADRIERTPNIAVFTHSEVREVVANDRLEAVVVEDRRTSERRQLPARALFVFIGAEPHTGWLSDQVALDDSGYVLTGNDAARERNKDRWSGVDRPPLLLETSLPGIFAVGDIRHGSIKRVASAVGEGSMAVRLVHEHLHTQPHTEPVGARA
jgi:thioredoxin reductase (NADPH)